MCVGKQLENDKITENLRVSFDEKLNKLQKKCNIQEKDIKNLHMLQKSKTKEIESLHQEIQQMKEHCESLVSSVDVLKRSLQENEEKIKTSNKQNQENILQLNQEHFEKLTCVEEQIKSKNDFICEKEKQVKKITEANISSEEEIVKLRQEVKDKDDILNLVKKKEKSILKDIKRQLLNEKRTNEKLLEKIKEISSSQTDLDELLENKMSQSYVKEQNSCASSEVSGFSIQEVSKTISQRISINHTSSQISTEIETSQLSHKETSDLLKRISKLQEEKSNMQERLDHLESSCTSMAAELLEKSEIIQQYIGRTRTDAPHKNVKESLEEASFTKKMFTNKLKSLVTNQNEELEMKNLRQLNNKLTRILEEEFTKNKSLKQDLIAVTNQLQELKTST